MVEARASQPGPDVSRINRLTAISKENDARLVSSWHNRLRGLWGSTAINVRFRVLGDYPHHSLALITVSATLVFPPHRGL